MQKTPKPTVSEDLLTKTFDYILEKEHCLANERY